MEWVSPEVNLAWLSYSFLTELKERGCFTTFLLLGRRKHDICIKTFMNSKQRGLFIKLELQPANHASAHVNCYWCKQRILVMKYWSLTWIWHLSLFKDGTWPSSWTWLLFSIMEKMWVPTPHLLSWYQTISQSSSAFQKYLLSAYYMPDPLSDVQDTMIDMTACFHKPTMHLRLKISSNHDTLNSLRE